MTVNTTKYAEHYRNLNTKESSMQNTVHFTRATKKFKNENKHTIEYNYPYALSYTHIAAVKKLYCVLYLFIT